MKMRPGIVHPSPHRGKGVRGPECQRLPPPHPSPAMERGEPYHRNDQLLLLLAFFFFFFAVAVSGAMSTELTAVFEPSVSVSLTTAPTAIFS